MIETERLILRPFSIFDVEDFYEYAKSKDVGPNAGWAPHNNIEESREIIKRFIGCEYELAIVLKSVNKVVGSISFWPDKRQPNNPFCRNLGYVLGKDYWGYGLMPEAVNALIDYLFTKTNTNLITVSHFPSNKRSRRVIEKCGFTFDRILYDAYMNYNGQSVTLYCHYLSKQDYLQKKTKSSHKTH